MLRTGKYPTQQALAEAMGISKGQMSKVLSRATQAGVVTRGEILSSLQRGRQIPVDFDDPEMTGEALEAEDF